jgi:hypothetical protein
MQDFIKHFVRVGPGMWTCVRNGDYQGPHGRVQVTVGSTFTIGTSFMGVDMAALLEERFAVQNTAAATPPRGGFARLNYRNAVGKVAQQTRQAILIAQAVFLCLLDPLGPLPVRHPARMAR